MGDSPWNLASSMKQADCKQQCKQERCVPADDICFSNEPKVCFDEDPPYPECSWNENYDECQPGGSMAPLAEGDTNLENGWDSRCAYGYAAQDFQGFNHQDESVYAKATFCITDVVANEVINALLLPSPEKEEFIEARSETGGTFEAPQAATCGEYLGLLLNGEKPDRKVYLKKEWGCNDQAVDLFMTKCYADTLTEFTNCLVRGGRCALKCNEECARNHTPSEREVRRVTDVLKGWESAVSGAFQADENRPIAVDESSARYLIGPFLARSSGDLVRAAGSADIILLFLGFFSMLLFASVSLTRMNWLESRMLVGFTGVSLVIVSTLASFGVSALCNIPLGPNIISVLPFLALGLGVDDMFVMAFAMKFNLDDDAEWMTSEMLKEAGASIALTSVCNMVAFLIGATIPLPAASEFCFAGAIVVAMNFFIVLFAFTGVLAWDAQRRLDEKKDCLICCYAPEDSIETAKDYGSDESMADNIAYYCMKTPVRIFCLFLSLALVGIAAYGAQLLEVGLPLGDIVPATHYSSKFLSMHEEFYSEQPAAIGIGMEKGTGKQIIVDYPTKLRELVEMEKAIYQAPSVISEVGMSIHHGSWITGLVQFANAQEVCFVATDGLDCDSLLDKEGPAYENENFWKNLAPGKKKEFHYLENATMYYPKPEHVYTLLGYFLNDLMGQSHLVRIKFCPTSEEEALKLGPSFVADYELWKKTFDSGKLTLSEMDAGKGKFVCASKMDFYVRGLVKTNDYLTFIRGVRRAVDEEVTTPGTDDKVKIPAFAMGFMFDFYEQYMNVNDYMVKNLGYAFIGVTVTSFFFLFHPMAVFIMMVSIAFIVGEVYGFMVWFGVKTNGVAVVNLVVAVGVSVESTAHITRLFVITPGDSKADRAEHALASMLSPIMFGNFSTFLGVFFTVFSKFPYFRLYYFNLITCVLIFGAFNGLMFLPAMLSFIGPAPISMDADEPPPGHASNKVAPGDEGYEGDELVKGDGKADGATGDDKTSAGDDKSKEPKAA